MGLNIISETWKVQDKNNTAQSRYIQAVSNVIKHLKSSSGSKREKFISKVKKQFKFDDTEKWVVTKLRMILFRMEADFNLLQINSGNDKKKKQKKKCEPKSQKETILMKAQRLKEKKDGIINEKLKIMQRNKENQNTKLQTKESKQLKTRKPRQRLEDKQLAKLWSLEFDDVNSKSASLFCRSKLEFMKSLHLMPNVVCL